MPKKVAQHDEAKKTRAPRKQEIPDGRPANPNRKFKFCMYHLQGVCKYSADACGFSHSLEDMNQAQNGTRRKQRAQEGSDNSDTRSQDTTVYGSTNGARSDVPSVGWQTRRDNTGAAGMQAAARADWAHLNEPMFVDVRQGSLAGMVAPPDRPRKVETGHPKGQPTVPSAAPDMTQAILEWQRQIAHASIMRQHVSGGYADHWSPPPPTVLSADKYFTGEELWNSIQERAAAEPPGGLASRGQHRLAGKHFEHRGTSMPGPARIDITTMINPAGSYSY